MAQNIRCNATDASKNGMGGIEFPSWPDDETLVWRTAWPIGIKNQLVSSTNMDGQITNSDLELAATILHEATIAAHKPMAKLTMYTGCDNVLTVVWRNKGSTTTDKVTAQLLRLASLQQRRLRHIPQLLYLPGHLNQFADILSRRLDLNDSQLIDLLH